MAAVEYRDIPGHPGYRVGSDGSVWSCWQKRGRGRGRGTTNVLGDTWKRLSETLHSGYPVVQLGRGNYFRTSRLVLLAFVGPCPEGMECRHLDGNPQNNHVDNLRWGTSAENTEDQRRHGTLIGG